MVIQKRINHTTADKSRLRMGDDFLSAGDTRVEKSDVIKILMVGSHKKFEILR
jgi:hypothetical protein